LSTPTAKENKTSTKAEDEPRCGPSNIQNIRLITNKQQKRISSERAHLSKIDSEEKLPGVKKNNNNDNTRRSTDSRRFLTLIPNCDLRQSNFTGEHTARVKTYQQEET